MNEWVMNHDVCTTWFSISTQKPNFPNGTTLVIQYYGYLLWNFRCCHCCCCLVLCQLIWFQFRINYYFEIENAIECSQTIKRIWFFFSFFSTDWVKESTQLHTHTQQFHKRFWIEAGGILFVIQSMTSMRLIYI